MVLGVRQAGDEAVRAHRGDRGRRGVPGHGAHRRDRVHHLRQGLCLQEQRAWRRGARGERGADLSGRAEEAAQRAAAEHLQHDRHRGPGESARNRR